MILETGAIGLDTVKTDVVRAGVGHWQRLKGGRTFPSKRHLVARDFGSLMRNLALVKVVKDGEDFQFRIWGEMHAQACGFNMQGGQIQDVRRVLPDFADALERAYSRVLITRQPYALRAVRERRDRLAFASENVLLPFSNDGSKVDHIMVFSAYTQLDLPQERAAC